jgi:tetratricopeptide (TPR) repeat protein
MDNRQIENSVTSMLENGRSDEAIGMLSRIIAGEPGDAAFATSQLASVHQYLGHENEARELYRSAMQLGDVPSAVSLGNIESERGDREEAKKLYRWAAEKGDLFGWRNLGIELNSEGRKDEAFQVLEESFRIGDSRSAYLYAEFSFEENDLQAAELWYQNAVDRGEVDGLVGLGRICRERERYDDALRYFREAVEAGAAESRVNLASLLVALDRIEEARSVFEQGVVAGDNTIWMDYGNLLSDFLNMPSDAEAAYRRAIGEGEILAHNNLGLLLEEEGRSAEAMAEFEAGSNAGDNVAADNYRRLLRVENGV